MSENQEAESIPKLFGKNVQKYRKKAGLTQEQLSLKLQISQKHLSIIETGTQFASAQLIAKISSALDVPPAMLFGGYEHEVNYEQANATALLLEKFIQSQLSLIHTRLSIIESKLK
ncbi:MAG: helix-turn-helix transcriptional regulator [Treponema sp.]|nr:helix-turn-helix transcriptional regulator [Treponema sp.]